MVIEFLNGPCLVSRVEQLPSEKENGETESLVLTPTFTYPDCRDEVNLVSVPL